MKRVDVAVIGGGPAGSSAAHAAAAGGADVVFFEKGVPREDRDGPGPDSTDAAGILDYWVDLMGLDPADFPDGIILRELDRADFIAPTETVSLHGTGIDSSYPNFGFTYDRAAFDDWLIDRAEAAGAEYRLAGVRDVDTSVTPSPQHVLTLRDGGQVVATHLVLADGPQRTVTMGVLDRFLPAGRAEAALGSTHANHIAYQEYREFPDAVFEPDALKFWWGHMPGHTAYPWVFPNEDTVARVGLTMPIGLDLDTVRDRDEYALLRSDDDHVPRAGTYIERLLEFAYPEYDLDDFPLVAGKGKRDGTETYPISSTRPVDSPTAANIAVVGGAMGATSAFHEGGGHLAVRTGAIAGDLAARGALHRYNRAWKDALASEVRRNIAMAGLVEGFGPRDWDRAFGVTNRLLDVRGRGITLLRGARAAGLTGLRLAAAYKRLKYRHRGDRIVQIAEDEYAVR